MAELFLLYLVLGVVAGTIAGLFGIGGGLILVPFIHLSLNQLEVPKEIIMQMSIGTSLATIFITGMSSTYSHYKLGSIDWMIFRKMAIGVVIGTFLGGQVATRISGHVLEVIFLVYILVVAVKMWFDAVYESSSKKTSPWLFNLVGFIVGFKSAILGIGGGTITIPFLSWRGLAMKKTVGISAALGLPISIVGALTYMYNGLGAVGLPEYSLGFVYLPAVLGITLVSSLFARIGAHLSHRLPQAKMKKGFALLLMVIAVKAFFF